MAARFSAKDGQPDSALGDAPGWLINLVLAASVGLAYFLAVRLAFGLLTTDKVAVFWPASGVAAGALIVLGPSARWPVVTGVMTAVLAAHLLTAKPFAPGIVSAIADGAEVSIIAGVVRRFFGPTFDLTHFREVLGLFAAAICGIAVSAIGGVVASRLQVTPALDSIVTSYMEWVASNTIGVLIVAPLIIGFAAAWRNRPPLREVTEGVAGLAALAAMTAGIVLLPQELWRTFVPIIWLIPVFTWIAGRCRPVFAAGGAFVVCITIVSTAVAGVGQLDDSLRGAAEKVGCELITIDHKKGLSGAANPTEV